MTSRIRFASPRSRLPQSWWDTRTRDRPHAGSPPPRNTEATRLQDHGGTRRGEADHFGSVHLDAEGIRLAEVGEHLRPTAPPVRSLAEAHPVEGRQRVGTRVSGRGRWHRSTAETVARALASTIRPPVPRHGRKVRRRPFECTGRRPMRDKSALERRRRAGARGASATAPAVAQRSSHRSWRTGVRGSRRMGSPACVVAGVSEGCAERSLLSRPQHQRCLLRSSS